MLNLKNCVIGIAITALSLPSTARSQNIGMYNDMVEAMQSVAQKQTTPLSENYSRLKVNYATGQPDIRIPLLSLDTKFVDLSLSMSYNTTGIRIQENPGLLGYGWDINSGFRITRVLCGNPDENHPVYQDSVKCFYDRNYLKSNNYYGAGKLYKTYYRGNTGDSEYDKFRIDLPDLTASFILECHNGVYSARLIKEAPVTIKVLTSTKNGLNNIYGFEVIDNSGTHYLFGGLSPDDQASADYTETFMPTNKREYPSNDGITKSWMLHKIIQPDNDEILFSYVDTKDYPDFIPSSHTMYVSHDFLEMECPYLDNIENKIIWGKDLYPEEKSSYPFLYPHPFWVEQTNLGFDFMQELYWDNRKLIKSIEKNDRAIVFSYITTPKTFVLQSSISSADHKTYTFDRYILNKIEVYNRPGPSPVKTVTFTTNEGFLEQISVSDKGNYDFKYDRRDKNFTREKFMRAIDWWGYCNGRDNGSELPFPAWQWSFGQQHIGDSVWYAKRAPDSLYMTIRSLGEITYPTGGKATIAYEPHKFGDGSFGGGLRVKTVTTYDPFSRKSITTGYRYEEAHYCYNKYGKSRLQIEDDSFPPNPDPDHIPMITTITDHWEARPTPSFPNSPSFIYNALIQHNTYFSFPQHVNEVPFQAWYGKITETTGDARTEYRYRYDMNEEYILSTTDIWGDKVLIDKSYIITAPLLTKKTDYRRTLTGTFEKLRTAEYQYTADTTNLFDMGLTQPGINLSCTKTNTFHPDMPGSGADAYKRGKGLYYLPERHLRMLSCGSVNLTRITEKSYSNGDSSVTTTNMRYDLQRPYNIRRKEVVSNSRETITETLYYYSNNFPLSNPSPELSADDPFHKSTVIQEMTYRNGVLVKNNVKRFTKINPYLCVVDREYDGINADSVKKTCSEVAAFDKYGNPVHIIENGSFHKVILWSYYGAYPVAEVRNATFAQVARRLPAFFTDSLPSKQAPSALDWKYLDNLRHDPGLKDALVTTCQYKPMVGPSKHTDPRGVVSTYTYDYYGRLQEVSRQDKGAKMKVQENKYKFYNR